MKSFHFFLVKRRIATTLNSVRGAMTMAAGTKIVATAVAPRPTDAALAALLRAETPVDTAVVVDTTAIPAVVAVPTTSLSDVDACFFILKDFSRRRQTSGREEGRSLEQKEEVWNRRSKRSGTEGGGLEQNEEEVLNRRRKRSRTEGGRGLEQEEEVWNRLGKRSGTRGGGLEQKEEEV